MVITIEDNVIEFYNSNPHTSTNLIQLMPMFVKKRHMLFLDINKNDISLFKSSIFASFYEYLQAYIKKIEKYNEQITKSTSYFVKIVLDSEVIYELKEEYEKQYPEAIVSIFNNGERLVLKMEGKTLDLITANLIEEYLCNPLKVIVEDIESDNLFLRKCIECLLGINPDSLYIEFVNGAGSNTKKNLQYYKRKNNRVFCLIDGDEISPGEYAEQSKLKAITEIREICELSGFNYFILRKREIENYIPDPILLKRKNKHNERFFELSESQKDYFDMKNGIKVKDLQYDIWKQLFEGVNFIDENEILIKGFGKKIWRAFEEVSSSDELTAKDKNKELHQLVKSLLDVV